ncbi:hypothetical protein [uncultured Fretibacterium sp.]|uniref:tetratricopeptide repeat protein n=1 Tax=uncultured Fretibacterium sp. TaxID=1678694 RepID=UPI002607924F|nr:hypothetical protein [uncultured Fretibacterium sp.]
MKRIFAALLLLPFLALGADGSYEEGLEARRAGDYTEALNQWMLASDDPRCMTAIAVMYDYGEGVSQDEGLAGEWYRRAEAKGDYRAMAQLANFSLSGVGGERRSPMEWRAKLEEAKGKDPYVDYVLAFFYANAHGGERRLDDALALLDPLVGQGFEQFLPLYRDVEQRIADRKEGVQEASVLAREIAQGEASFDRRWKDKRIVVSGYVNTLERLNDYGYVLKFGPSSPSLIPKDNLQAVFYAPSLATPLAGLKPGNYVKLDGVYVGRLPFALEACALTLVGCDLLQTLSDDVR